MIGFAFVASSLCLAMLAKAKFSLPAVFCTSLLLPVLVISTSSPLVLIATMIVEATVVLVCAKMMKINLLQAMLTSCFINILTQPLLFFAVEYLNVQDVARWWLSFGALELAVCCVEALLYLALLENFHPAWRHIPKALMMSFAANTASAGLGLLLPV